MYSGTERKFKSKIECVTLSKCLYKAHTSPGCPNISTAPHYSHPPINNNNLLISPASHTLLRIKSSCIAMAQSGGTAGAEGRVTCLQLYQRFNCWIFQNYGELKEAKMPPLSLILNFCFCFQVKSGIWPKCPFQ